MEVSTENPGHKDFCVRISDDAFFGGLPEQWACDRFRPVSGDATPFRDQKEAA